MKLYIITLFSLSLLSVSHFSFAETINLNKLHILTCDCPPMTFPEKEKAAGLATEIVKAIQKNLNNRDDILVLPWARGYHLAKTEKNTLLFSTTKTKEREALFKWVGPIAKKDFGFYTLENSLIKIKNLNDAKKYLIGVHRASNNEEFLVSEGFKKIVSTNSEKQNLIKLQKKRIDLWFTDSSQVNTLESQHKDASKLTLAFSSSTNYSYIAFNINTSDEIVNSWQHALNEITKSGELQKIFQKEGLVNLFPD